MNLFKKDPIKIFQLIAAIFLVLLAFYLVLYFELITIERYKVSESDRPSKPMDEISRQVEEGVDYEQFGAIHVEVDSPSYARSNFDVNPSTDIVMYFNEAVNIQDVIGNFKLLEEDTRAEVAMDVESQYRNEVSGEISNDKKWEKIWQQRLIFSPLQELKPVTMYWVELKGGYYNESGTGTAPNNFRFSFLTADTPGVLSTNLDNREYVIKQQEDIKIIFRSPVSEEELNENLIITPFSEIDLRVTDKIAVISNTLDRGSYTVSIPANLEDIYGRPLGEDFVLEFSVN